jgi:hypothetical protein
MKKYIVLSVLSLLPNLAHANTSQVKTYLCDGGIRLKIRFQVSGGEKYADSLKLEGSDQDGTYRPLGDGFGFIIKGGAPNKLFLDENLYNLQDSGILMLNTQIKCTD